MARQATYLKWIVGLELRDETLQIADHLHINRCVVAVSLMNVWARAWGAVSVDSDGHGRIKTDRQYPLELIDAWAGDIDGFGRAMARTGWLEQQGAVLVFKNWALHNGDVALSRAKESAARAVRRAKARTRQADCPDFVRAEGGQPADKTRTPLSGSGSPELIKPHPQTPASGGRAAGGGQSISPGEAERVAAVLVRHGAKATNAARVAVSLLQRHGSLAAAELIAEQWMHYATLEHADTEGGGIGIAMNALRDGEPCPDNGRTYADTQALIEKANAGAKGADSDGRGTAGPAAGGVARADDVSGATHGEVRDGSALADAGGGSTGGGEGRGGRGNAAVDGVPRGSRPGEAGGDGGGGVSRAGWAAVAGGSVAAGRTGMPGPVDARSDRGGAADGALAVSADCPPAGGVAGGLAQHAVLPDAGGGRAADGAGGGISGKPLCLVRVAR